MQQQHQHTRHVSFDRRVTRDINICVTLYVSHVFHVGTRSVYFNLMICPCARTIRLFHTWIWTRSCFIVFIFIYLFIFLWQMIPVFLRGFLNHTIRRVMFFFFSHRHTTWRAFRSSSRRNVSKCFYVLLTWGENMIACEMCEMWGGGSHKGKDYYSRIKSVKNCTLHALMRKRIINNNYLV